MSQVSKTPNSHNSISNINSRISREEATTLASQSFPSENLEIIDVNVKTFSARKLGYLGVHELLTIEARERNNDANASKKTLTFFVKTVLPNSNAFDQKVFQEEFKFYDKAVPQLMKNVKLEPWAAKCYLAKENLLVLEDLKSKGFKVTCGPLNDHHMKSALACVARFHACSMLLKNKLQQSLRNVYGDFFKQKSFFMEGEFSRKWLLTGIEVAEAIARKLDLNPEHVSNAYELAIEKLKPVEEEKNVLCHADLWSNNIMFKEDNGMSCRLVDFQLTLCTCYAVDLAHIIYFNTTIDARERFEKEWIECYHTVMKETLQIHGFDEKEIISLEEVIRDFEQKRICGLAIAVQYLPIGLLNESLSQEYTKDVERLRSYRYSSRKDFILRAMELDRDYQIRIEEAVQSLIEYMQTTTLQ